MITIIDMGLGNLNSVQRALQRVGAETAVTNQPCDVENADIVVLPGVGAFGDGMAGLVDRGLVDPIRRHVKDNKPLLGICLGMQLLADKSQEHGEHEGLGLIPGRVTRLQPTSDAYRVPNMGWCDVSFSQSCSPFEQLTESQTFYFAHSYFFDCETPEHSVATIDYEHHPITVAVQRGSVFGVQFHPEKSQDSGLKFLESFVQHVRG